VCAGPVLITGESVRRAQADEAMTRSFGRIRSAATPWKSSRHSPGAALIGEKPDNKRAAAYPPLTRRVRHASAQKGRGLVCRANFKIAKVPRPRAAVV